MKDELVLEYSEDVNSIKDKLRNLNELRHRRNIADGKFQKAVRNKNLGSQKKWSEELANVTLQLEEIELNDIKDSILYLERYRDKLEQLFLTYVKLKEDIHQTDVKGVKV